MDTPSPLYTQVQEAATRLIGLLERARRDGKQRVVVSIAGIPGAGKSYFSQLLCDELNSQLAVDGKDVAIVVPMDGFHLYRAQLDMMDDPKLAHRRRGAHWTFDGQGFVDLIERIVREPGETMLAPTFDHAEKDPRPDDIAVRPEHCMVILEGLYLQLKSLSPWSKLPELVDEAWWIESRDLDAVKERLVVRYLEAGMTESREKAIFRIDDSDRLNGTFILQNRISDPDYIIYN